jgi:hypothetical protein
MQHNTSGRRSFPSESKTIFLSPYKKLGWSSSFYLRLLYEYKASAEPSCCETRLLYGYGRERGWLRCEVLMSVVGVAVVMAVGRQRGRCIGEGVDCAAFVEDVRYSRSGSAGARRWGFCMTVGRIDLGIYLWNTN